MFIHLFKYKLKMAIRPTQELFWTLCFPILLGTMFFIAFGNILAANENFEIIPVSVVNESGAPSEFTSVLDELAASGENQLLELVPASDLSEAKDLLKNAKISGIITIGETPALIVKENGINQSILKAVLDQYQQISSTIKNAATTNPEAIQSIVSTLSSSISTNKEILLTDETNTDCMTWYYFALISMTCLYGGLLGLKCALSIQANLSSLAMRRSISPTHKLKLILADYTSAVCIQFASLVILICYLVFVLGINFGNKLGLTFVTAFVGSIIGVANGVFIGSLGKKSENFKSAVLLGITMLCCFLGGLMDCTMRYKIEDVFPLFNRINPSALISDALYSLSIYDNYDRYLSNMLILIVMSIVMCLISYLIVRREKYASL